MPTFRTHDKQGNMIPSNLKLLRAADFYSFIAGSAFVAIALILGWDRASNLVAHLLGGQDFPGHLRTAASFLAITSFAVNQFVRFKLAQSRSDFHESLRSRFNP